jgi:hypothetical protein
MLRRDAITMPINITLVYCWKWRWRALVFEPGVPVSVDIWGGDAEKRFLGCGYYCLSVGYLYAILPTQKWLKNFWLAPKSSNIVNYKLE